MLNSTQDLIHCDKCHKLLNQTRKKGRINILCDKCEIDWQLFFKDNYVEIEKEFENIKEGQPNPTWYVFLGKVKRRKIVKFIFR